LQVLVIADREVMESTFKTIPQQVNTVRVLVLAHEFFVLDFSRRSPSHLGLLLKMPKVRQLFVLPNEDYLLNKKTAVVPQSVRRIQARSLQTICFSGVLLPYESLVVLAEKYGESCRELLLGACLCESRKSEEYLETIGKNFT
jgi:hypothetical protein